MEAVLFSRPPNPFDYVALVFGLAAIASTLYLIVR